MVKTDILSTQNVPSGRGRRAAGEGRSHNSHAIGTMASDWSAKTGERTIFWPLLICGASGIAVSAAVLTESPGTSPFVSTLFLIPILSAAYRYGQRGLLIAALLGAAYIGLAGALPGGLVQAAAFLVLAFLAASLRPAPARIQSEDQGRIDDCPLGTCLVHRKERRITDINRQLAGMLGYDPGELIDAPILRIWPFPDDQRRFFESLAGEGDAAEIETRFVGKDGSSHWISLSGRCASGGIVCQAVDIDRYKWAETALGLEQKRFYAVLESLPAHISLQAPDYTVRYANRAFRETFGDPDGRCCYEIHYGLKKPCRSCPPFLALDLKNLQQWEWEHPNGRTYGSYAYPFIDIDGSELILMLGIDATERKQAEEALKSYAQSLQKQNKEMDLLRRQMSIVNRELESMVRERTAEVERLLRQKDEFISQLGHDLKTPLTPLVALLPRITKQEKDPKVRELLEIATHNVNYMKDLVVKTLKLARLNTVYIELDIEDVHLKSEVGAVIQHYDFKLRDRRIAVENQVPESMVVQGDRVLIGEIFDNLISNAMKYTGEDGGTITISAFQQDGTVTVSTRDTGIGMTQEEADHIFNEFYKADASRHDLDSFGLGLSICRRIVERHGGKIWAESPGRGRGSTIFFTLRSPGERNK
ncbi:sensory transduction histidine kinase [hydrocarbon metagenome]|uniref:histidine kinase n=1 Tax=hydrocarbon metagenome TaxID=938273 RepID=A0A0W8FJ20_9ZZZZ